MTTTPPTIRTLAYRIRMGWLDEYQPTENVSETDRVDYTETLAEQRCTCCDHVGLLPRFYRDNLQGRKLYVLSSCPSCLATEEV